MDVDITEAEEIITNYEVNNNENYQMFSLEGFY